MKIKVLRAFVTGDGLLHAEGDVMDVPAKNAKSLIQANLAQQVIERAVSKPRKEKR